MFKEEDYCIYKRDLCKVKEIKRNYINNLDYYILAPIEDKSLIIQIPTENKTNLLRNVVSKEEANKIIESIPKIEVLAANEKLMENTYRTLINSGNHEDLIKIIKTTYLRNDLRKKEGKRISDKDDIYFNKAEKYLYNELSVALDMQFDECKSYVMKRIEQLINN